MTISRFGKIMPIHGDILSLIGWQLARNNGTYLIAEESKRVAEMRRGHRALVARTRQDFGFDLAAWRDYLLTESELGYCHPYAFSGVDSAVQDAIADPEFARLAVIAATPTLADRASQ